MSDWQGRRQQLLAEKKSEVMGLAGLDLNQITPSRRDFTQFVSTQKTGIALVARLKRADPHTGASWRDVDLTALARRCDDTEVGAIAVATAEMFGGRIDDLRAVAAAVTAPILRDDLCLHANQVYQARLFGADAVVFPAAQVAADLASLLDVAASLHMAAVIEICSESDLALIADHRLACVGVQCTAADGFADLARARALAERIPSERCVLLLSEVREIESLRAAHGLIDAAVVGNALLDAEDPASVIEAFLEDG